MRYTEKDIRNIPLTEFMAALGEKPAVVYEGASMYYTPYRDDPEPIFLVNSRTNCWHDYATDDSGGLIELASLTMNPDIYKNPIGYILKMMNDYEQGKELSAMPRQPLEPKVATPDIRKIKLTDFMKALGQEQPVTADGNLHIYKAPYDPMGAPTMIINTETNLWHDTQSGAYGGLYDLAYEMTGSCNMRELNMYIAGEMSNNQKVNLHQKPTEPPKQETAKPKRKMRL